VPRSVPSGSCGFVVQPAKIQAGALARCLRRLVWNVAPSGEPLPPAALAERLRQNGNAYETPYFRTPRPLYFGPCIAATQNRLQHRWGRRQSEMLCMDQAGRRLSRTSRSDRFLRQWIVRFADPNRGQRGRIPRRPVLLRSDRRSRGSRMLVHGSRGRLAGRIDGIRGRNRWNGMRQLQSTGDQRI
jgi:hypothetical protein